MSGKLVGAVGFEPTASCSRSKRASRAALRPEYPNLRRTSEVHRSYFSMIYLPITPRYLTISRILRIWLAALLALTVTGKNPIR